MAILPTGKAMDTQSALTQLSDVARAAVEHAGRLGASQAEAGASLERGLSVTVRLGEIETLEHQQDRGLGVTVYLAGRKGSASTADLSAEAVRQAVEKACSIARYTAVDEFAGLADASLMATEFPDLDLHHPWEIDADRARDLALSCEAAALASDRRLSNSEGATLQTGSGVRVYANSHGFCAGIPSSYHSLSCVVLAADDSGMERDYWYSADRDWRRLEAAEAIGLEAARRAVRRLGARRLDTREVPVVFAPEVARGLIGHLIAAIRGTAQYREASFLLGAAGRQVFPTWFQIDERPHLRGAIGSAAWDNEGVATRERRLVSDGRLTGYVLSSYAARKLGVQTTGNAGGVHNLEVLPSDGGLEALLVRMGTGLLVTELMGQGVNIVTGDYSRGAAGFWVEGGELAGPVSEITIAGSLAEMFAGVVATGSDVDTRGAIRCGSLLLERMTVAGS
jgi:PmbA protein